MRLVELAHSKIKKILRPGDSCIDATAGNGYDTLFLAQQISPDGVVYAFDIQNSALLKTNERLKNTGFEKVVRLFQQSHEEISKFVDHDDHGKLKAAMFNLGYLPGGDHQIKTTPNTTIPALENLYAILKYGGLITLICYRGHTGGGEEADGIIELCNVKKWKHDIVTGSSNCHSPILICIKKD